MSRPLSHSSIFLQTKNPGSLTWSFPPSLPHCPLGHTGWSNRVEYEPGTGALAVFPNIHLETCDEPVALVQATVELETSHIGKGCDRDTYSEKSLHRLCGKRPCVLSLPSLEQGTLTVGQATCVCVRCQPTGTVMLLPANPLKGCSGGHMCVRFKATDLKKGAYVANHPNRDEVRISLGDGAGPEPRS